MIYTREDDALIGKVEGVKEELSWRAVDLVGFRQAFIASISPLRRRYGHFHYQ